MLVLLDVQYAKYFASQSVFSVLFSLSLSFKQTSGSGVISVFFKLRKGFQVCSLYGQVFPYTTPARLNL